jgi:hypothetical protein
MIASVLMAKSTTAVMTIATGVFIVTSPLRIYRPSFRFENEPTLNERDWARQSSKGRPPMEEGAASARTSSEHWR